MLDALGYTVNVITDGCRGVNVLQDGTRVYGMAAAGATLYTLADWERRGPGCRRNDSGAGIVSGHYITQR